MDSFGEAIANEVLWFFWLILVIFGDVLWLVFQVALDSRKEVQLATVGLSGDVEVRHGASIGRAFRARMFRDFGGDEWLHQA